LLGAIEGVPGVDRAVGQQFKNIPYGAAEVFLTAFDAPCFTDRRACDWALLSGALPGALESVARGEAVIVSTSFAHQHAARAGDVVRLSSPHGELALPIAGVTRGQPESAVIMSRATYRAAWNDPLISWAHVVVTPGAKPSSVETAIGDRLGVRYRVHVRSTAAIIQYFADQARQAFSLLYLMEAITFLLVLLAIGDTLATSVVERTREFGMLRAVGLGRSRLFEMVLLEGTAIGLLGVVLAGVAGLTLGLFWVEIQFPALLGWKLDLHVPVEFVSMAAVLTLLLCLAGAFMPAWRASRLSVPVALRDE
jgi:putative ABC transport system permease protein